MNMIHISTELFDKIQEMHCDDKQEMLERIEHYHGEIKFLVNLIDTELRKLWMEDADGSEMMHEIQESVNYLEMKLEEEETYIKKMREFNNHERDRYRNDDGLDGETQ